MFDDESWAELFQSYLGKRKRFSVSILLGRNPLFVITLWLEFEVVWLCRCLINVFGGLEHTYEEWADKAAFQFHSFHSRLVPLPSWTAYFCVFKEKEGKKVFKRRESCVNRHFLPGFSFAFHCTVCVYRSSRYKLVHWALNACYKIRCSSESVWNQIMS